MSHNIRLINDAEVGWIVPNMSREYFSTTLHFQQSHKNHEVQKKRTYYVNAAFSNLFNRDRNSYNF